MRVLHINANYLYNNLHQCMIRALTERGVDNQVFTPIHSQDNLVVTPDENVTTSVCYKKLDRFFFYKKQKKIRNALEANVNVRDFDLLHAYTIFTDGNCAYKLSQKYNIPYVVAVRNTDVNIFFELMPHLRKRGISVMRKASAICFLSEVYRTQVFEKYIPKRYHEELLKKSHIIPNGIDPFWFENCRQDQMPKEDNSLRVIYAGRIDKNKNIGTTQKALDLLRKKGYSSSLTVVGGVTDKQVYKQLQKHPGTTFLPPVKKEELVRLYRQHDIFVMPSFTESFGLVYAEAISQSLPVVYSRGQGFDRQFPEGTVGYRAEANSPASVAEAIEKIIADYDTITDGLCEQAKCFSWNKITMQYVDIYSRIV